MEPTVTTTGVAKSAFNVLVKHSNQGDTAMPDNDYLTTLQSRNTLAPIHVLPEELLVNIWLLCISDASQIDDLLHTLALVCKAWYRGVLKHPVLWCHLQDSCKTEWYNDWVLRKSRNCPLHMRLSSPDATLSDALIDMAMPHCRRWKSFILAPHLQAGSSALEPYLDTLANAKLDILTSFEAQPRTAWGQLDPISLPATPSLREMRLGRFPLHWETFNAPQLRALRISKLQFDESPFYRLLDLLRSTPFLEILLIKDTDFPLFLEDAHPHQNLLIHLPRLRALYLSSSSRAIRDDLLRLIRTDSLQQLLGRTVSFKLWEPPRVPILDNIKSMILPIGAIKLHYRDNIHIATNPHPFYPIEWPYHDDALTTKGFAFTSTHEARMEDFLDITRWVSTLGAHAIVKLELSNPHRSSTNFRDIPVVLLEHLPTLHTLVLREGIKVDALFAQLGRPKRESCGRLHWPWPQLVHLDTWNSDRLTAEVLIDLAQSRWGNIVIPSSTSEPSVEPTMEERPPKLKSLTTSYKIGYAVRLQVEALALEGGP
ncbi:hypothetical protein FRC00_002857 [Tulasnella sp. 408]|nr:hypothetical protein FRC00_002857 [Tulasnella sp. 408]